MKNTKFYFIFSAEGSFQEELQTRGQPSVVLINMWLMCETYSRRQPDLAGFVTQGILPPGHAESFVPLRPCGVCHPRLLDAEAPCGHVPSAVGCKTHLWCMHGVWPPQCSHRHLQLQVCRLTTSIHSPGISSQPSRPCENPAQIPGAPHSSCTRSRVLSLPRCWDPVTAC